MPMSVYSIRLEGRKKGLFAIALVLTLQEVAIFRGRNGLKYKEKMK